MQALWLLDIHAQFLELPADLKCKPHRGVEPALFLPWAKKPSTEMDFFFFFLKKPTVLKTVPSTE